MKKIKIIVVISIISLFVFRETVYSYGGAFEPESYSPNPKIAAFLDKENLKLPPLSCEEAKKIYGTKLTIVAKFEDAMPKSEEGTIVGCISNREPNWDIELPPAVPKKIIQPKQIRIELCDTNPNVIRMITKCISVSKVSINGEDFIKSFAAKYGKDANSYDWGHPDLHYWIVYNGHYFEFSLWFGDNLGQLDDYGRVALL